MTAMNVIVGLALVVNGALLFALPVLSRRSVFFSVTVPEQFRDDAAARATLFRYRLFVVSSTVVALVFFMNASSMPASVPAPFIQGIGGMMAWARARRQVSPYAAPMVTHRAASLVPRDLRLPGGWLAASGPFIVLLAAALLLFFNWDRIPDRFPTHWSTDGSPNRWTLKSAKSVYGTLLMGAVVAGLTLAQTLLILRRTRQIAIGGLLAEAEIGFKRRNALYGVMSMYGMALLFSYFATRKVLAVTGHLGFEVWIFLGLIVAGAVVMTTWMIRVGQGGSLVHGLGASSTLGDGTPDGAWKAGLFYFNPSDPALLVENRMGFGWTLNLGNKWSWLVLGVLLVPAAIAALTR